MKTILRLIAVLMLSLLSLVWATQAQNASGTSVNILSQQVNPPASVQVEARVATQGGVITGLDASHFDVTGDEPSNLSVATRTDGNIDLIFLIDTSQGSDVASIRSVLRAYFENADYYRNGDNISFFVMNNSGTYSTPDTSSRENIYQAINNLSLGTSYSRPSEVLPNVLAQAQSTDGPIQVVYVASLIFNATGVDEQVQRFRNANIPIHVVHTHNGRDSAPFLSITGGSNGVFINNEGNSFVGTGNGQYFALDQLEQLYNDLNDNRLIYEITYESVLAANTERNAQLVVTPPSGVSGEAAFQYDPVFTAPTVEIVGPTNSQPVRRFDTEGNLNNPQTSVFIDVGFPDGFRRGLSEVRLEFVDQSDTGIQPPIVLENPVFNPDDDLALTWNLEDYSQEGTTTDLQLRVTVVDEFGLSSSASQPGVVTVGLVPTIVPEGENIEPNVAIIEPRPITPQRGFIPGIENTLDNETINVVLEVVLPPDETGTVDSVQTVNFVVTDPALQIAKQSLTFDATVFSVTDPNPQDAAINVTIPWDLSSYSTPDSVTNLEVQASVITANGLNLSTQPQEAIVSVAPPIPELPPICTFFGLTGNTCSQVLTIVPIVQIVLIVILIIAVIYLFVTPRGRQIVESGVTSVTNVSKTAIESATSIFGVTGNDFGGMTDNLNVGPVLGDLRVVEGGDLLGEFNISVNKAVFSLGRHLPSGVDHVINLPGVSRLHCTIQQAANGFEIRDEQSQNGTYVNNRKLPSHSWEPLRPGDIIRFSKIKMEWVPSGASPAGSPAMGTGGETALEMPIAGSGMAGGTEIQQPAASNIPQPPSRSGNYTEVQQPAAQRPAVPPPPGQRSQGQTEVEPQFDSPSRSRLPAAGPRRSGDADPPQDRVRLNVSDQNYADDDDDFFDMDKNQPIEPEL